MNARTHCLFGGALASAGLVTSPAAAQEFTNEGASTTAYLIDFDTGTYVYASGIGLNAPYGGVEFQDDAYNYSSTSGGVNWDAFAGVFEIEFTIPDNAYAMILELDIDFTVPGPRRLSIEWNFTQLGDADMSWQLGEAAPGSSPFVLDGASTSFRVLVGDPLTPAIDRPRAPSDLLSFTAPQSSTILLEGGTVYNWRATADARNTGDLFGSVIAIVRPVPANFNNDNSLDFFDVIGFLAAFDAGDASVDFNESGDTSIADIEAFLASLAADL